MPGDKVIVSGFIGDHGIAVMSQRENLRFETPNCVGGYHPRIA